MKISACMHHICLTTVAQIKIFFHISSQLYYLTQKMHIAVAWMTEKYFAATPYTCHKQFQISIKICKKRIMAYGKVPLKLKDFEGIYATAYKPHFLG